MSLAAAIVVGVIVFAAANVQAAVGFGFSLFAVPLLSFPLDAKVAVVVAATVGLLNSGVNAAIERQHCDRPSATRMIVGAAIGSPIGAVLLDVTPERGLRVLLAIAIMAFVVLNVRGAELPTASPRLEFAAGVASGVLNTSLSTNGPPLVAVLHARHLPAAAFRATLSVVFAVSGVIAIALFAAADRYDAHAVRAILVALPALAIGLLTGSTARRHLHGRHFRRSVTVLLALTAVASAIAAVAG